VNVARPREPERPMEPGRPTAAAVGTRQVAACLRCNIELPVRNLGCRGGHCPNCRHPYPHGDCSD